MTDETEARKHIRALIDGITSVIESSEGVAGWHYNGQIAAWADFDELADHLSGAQAYLDAEPAVLTVEGGGDELERLRSALKILHDYAREMAGKLLDHTFIERCTYTALQAGQVSGDEPNFLAKATARIADLENDLAKQSEEMAVMRRAALEEVIKYHDTAANYATAECWANDAYVAGNANVRLRVHERAAEHFRALIEPKTGEGEL